MFNPASSPSGAIGFGRKNLDWITTGVVIFYLSNKQGAILVEMGKMNGKRPAVLVVLSESG